MRLVLPYPDLVSTGIVTAAVEPPSAEPTSLTLLLDIDVFREGQFDPGGPELWEMLERLRNLKNTIFEGSLTRKAKELFR
jgi:uncharacterized protein (TIGR04255 family)